ncbi:endonuclease/exonuclease/phosphatase family protein [Neorhizobium sp. IRAMC:178]|uniref:endonuclease/exonuclease/phosphatase family protein n=1 Tax=Neorhizobium tunisiense TaxID=3144793 RepID=UPI0031F6A00F
MTDQTAPAPSTARPSPARHRLKILSYNVHSCIGTDRRLDPARVAEVIAAVEPDIIGLQELDVGRSRTGGIDQAHAIASLLQMEFHFHAALNVAEEQYGDAILTALPARMVKGASLPSHGEQRGALWVEIEAGEHKLQVFNTHLGLLGGDRMRQIGEVLGESWMGAPDCQGKPKILIGDFNAIPLTATYKAVARQMADAPLLSGMKPRATFPSRLPLLRIDHVFVSSEITPIATQVVSTPLSRQASDHLPLLVTVEL